MRHFSPPFYEFCQFVKYSGIDETIERLKDVVIEQRLTK